MSRIKRIATWMKEHVNQLACPLCQAEMKIVEQRSLVCLNNHTFDIAKQGYINTLTRPVKTSYDKALFEARREIIQIKKLYDPLHQRMLEIMNELDDAKSPYILDAGAGEGSHLTAILNQTQTRKVGIGVDLSKEGIQIAARNDEAIWLVADLANIPLKDQSVQAILNILSPANYDEFNRVLTESGLLIKVVPASDYLKELRDVIFHSGDKKSYSNDKTISRFKEYFPNGYRDNLVYSKQLDRKAVASLLRMTPLAWNVNIDSILDHWNEDQTEITMAFDILIGRK